MRERERVRERGRDAPESNDYNLSIQQNKQRRDLAESGRVVVKRSELLWQDSEQGKMAYYLQAAQERFADIAIQDWRVFGHLIERQTGRHKHHGGVIIYVVRGRGYTMVNGVKKAWKAGDLLLLPVLPGGVDHQHWNEDPDEPSEWIGFRFIPFQYATGALLEQTEPLPDWEAS